MDNNVDHHNLQCPYCEYITANRESYRHHLNFNHALDVRTEDIAIHNMLVHDCGEVYTQRGLTRHVTSCRGAERLQEVHARAHARAQAQAQANEQAEEQAPAAQAGPQAQEEQAQEQQGELDVTAFDGDGDQNRRFLKLAAVPEIDFGASSTASKQSLVQLVQELCDVYLNHPTATNMHHILVAVKYVSRRKISDQRKAVRDFKAVIASPAPDFTGLDAQLHRPVRVADPPPDHQEQPRSNVMTDKEIKQTESYMKTGHYRKAAAVVRDRLPVASLTPENKAILEALHPEGELNPFADNPHAPGPVSPPFSNENLNVLDDLVRGLDLQSAAGISGWSARLVQMAYGDPTANTPFRRFLIQLARQIQQATAPARSQLCAARLTALQKAQNKLRPIACGEVIYRLIMRFLLKVLPTPEGALLLTQLGVGSPGGVEPAIELLCQRVENQLNDQELEEFLIRLDISNAFGNSARRAIAQAVREQHPAIFRLTKWAYNGATPLVMVDEDGIFLLKSSDGGRQGCPIMSLIFSLLLRNKLVALKNHPALQGQIKTVISYLDDINLICKRGDLIAAIETLFATEEGQDRPRDGLSLNIEKTKIDSLRDAAYDGEGLSVLGSCVGTVTARRSFLKTKTEHMRVTLHRLRCIPSQQALLLLRVCIYPELLHLLRTMDTSDLTEELKDIDNLFYNHVDYLRRSNPDVVRDPIITRIYSLPLSQGGFGLISYEEISPAARGAARDAAQDRLRVILPDDNPMPTVAEENPEPKLSQQARTRIILREAMTAFAETLSVDQRLAFIDNSSKGGTGWLRANPVGKYRSLTNSQIAAAINIRSLQPAVFDRPLCAGCGGDNRMQHYEDCPHFHPCYQYRHNQVRDNIIQTIRGTSREVRSEPSMYTNNTRRADIFVGAADGVNGPAHPQYGFLDVKVYSVFLNGDRARRQTARDQFPEASMKKAAWRQIAAVLDTTVMNTRASYPLPHRRPGCDQDVVPVVLSTGGTLHKEFFQLLKDLVPDAGARDALLINISIALVRARAKAYPVAA
jgi:hypothetical protein